MRRQPVEKPMLDAAFVRDNLAAVKANCANRNVAADVDAVVHWDDERKKVQRLSDETKAKQNEVSKKFPMAKTPEEKQTLKEESGRLKERVAGYDAELKKVEEELHKALSTLPNMTHPDVPVGTDASANK
ncbi:MAG TPA: serine--tRNA ligase, partial [Fimbriiglobus sp.]